MTAVTATVECTMTTGLVLGREIASILLHNGGAHRMVKYTETWDLTSMMTLY